MIYTWMGRDPNDMTKEELIVALEQLGHVYLAQLETTRKTNETWSAIASRR